jgi:DNA polymerase gamma 1
VVGTNHTHPDSANPLVPSEARFSPIGVQHLSSHIHSQIFPGASTLPPPELVALSQDHLSRHDLLGKNQDQTPPVGFDMPELQGTSLDEHFYKLGMDAAEPYLTMAKKLAWANPPPKPTKWVRRSGWTKYNSDGTTEAVDAPNETMLTFDTEVMWKQTSFACMACAASPTAWYAWLSPWLLGESKSDRHLIPLGDTSISRVIVGHNIGYDRARIAEEYNIAQSKNAFVDTMSLHVASNGMCSRQRPSWMKNRKSREKEDEMAASEENANLSTVLNPAVPGPEEELWMGRSAINSLRDVAKFHCNITLDKAQREYFGELDREGVMDMLDELLSYCAADVEITHRVYQKVFPLFLETCPHPVSFAALRFLAAEILPVNETWDAYLKNAEATYHHLDDAVKERLVALTEKALEVKEQPEVYENDPWLSQLDWSGQEVKMVKGKKKGDPPRPAARQKLPGMPKWYKDLFAKSDAPMALTVRTRITPILLKLAWDGNPLVWSDVYGWTYKVPADEAFAYDDKGLKVLDMSQETNLKLRDDTEYVYYKIPHKDGPLARCANPLAKGYLQYFEKGQLGSEYAYAKEALEMNASCSYWISARDRIMSQMVVYNKEVPDAPKLASASGKGAGKKVGFILPQIIPMGTVTRRSVENTWLTASNAKKNRVGSELKSMVRAPQGYCFVGADVDSQELWIASLIGDATFKLHGGNAVGFMTLEGTKAAGTDLHSRTAAILGISRNDAKVFNYGRIYGAGLKFASTLLRQFNPSLSEEQTSKTADDLYKNTKGKKTNRKQLHERPFWRGGTESFVFNKLEDFAEQERPRTPVLGAAITEALQRRYLSKGGFMTSRINWAIQSSGVDYLHLLIVSMDYLARRYSLDARLAITVHDEIRYLVKEKDRYKAAMALQVANVWTRAMFSQQMGINELPQSCAYFSAVDIDHVLRKEVDMDCITPSNKEKIPHGESLDITALLDKGEEARLDPAVVPKKGEMPTPQNYTHAFTPRTPIMTTLSRGDTITDPTAMAYLKAQISSSDQELRDILRPLRATPAPRSTGSKKTKSTAEKEVADIEQENREIQREVRHYEQMAKQLNTQDPWREVVRRVNAGTGVKGKGKSTGVWWQAGYTQHPRSSGARSVRA